MLLTFIIVAVLMLSAICVFMMIVKVKQQPNVKLTPIEHLKLIVSGMIAFVFDTIGVGSFTINIALAKIFGTFRDDEMPAVSNGAQVMPGVLESVFFIQLIDVDLVTLITLVTGTCIGGVVGGSIVSRLSKQTIRLAMVCCFSLIILLLIGNHFKLLPIGGDAIALNSWKLVAGFFAMIICGMLTSVGVGLFAMVQAVLFLLNLSPAVAFPIMTTAGAFQQPLTTMMFLKHDKIPLKKTLILSLAGCFGVLITLPVFTSLSITSLHALLVLILFYNAFSIGRTYLRMRPANKFTLNVAS